ncbi:MAG TPA: hypothetical protein VFB69_03365 [Candidatus Dormibacteraeota bacterium]|nr:hypothetical protein [Candidatus Dormibacteraeota bacterium]
MGHIGRVLVTLVTLVACVACGTTTLAGARPTPSQSPSPSAIARPTSSPTPTATPAPDYGPPPPGVDLFYVQWPATPTWLIGFDWSGRPRATVHLKELDGQAETIGSGILAAPNGTGFASGAYTFDRLGHVIYQGAPPNKGNLLSTWSEDGQLLCGVQEQVSAMDSQGNGTTDYYLVRRSPSGPPVQVRKFLHLNFVPGDSGYGLAACSHWLDRALLTKTVCCSVQGALVLRLSDGAQVGTWTRGVGVGLPVFSPDGQEVAEPALGAYGTTSSTTVRLILGGTVLARYGPGIDFLGFSGDNRFAVVAAGPQLQLVEVSTRRVVWRDSTAPKVARVIARPFSGDVVLAFGGNGGADTIEIVHPDGTSSALDGTWLVPMSWGSSP